MSASRSELLLGAMVDGTATADEREEFEALARSDPAFREDFEQAQTLSALLARVPQVEAPSGLAQAIMAKVTLSRQNDPLADQLPAALPVIVVRAGKSAGLEQFFRSIRFHKEHFMAEVKRGFLGTTRSRVLAGGALAVAALVVVSTQVNFPSSGNETAGTIAPAERYRSGQATDSAVQTPGNATSSTAAPGAVGAADNAANAAANRMANQANAAAADRAVANAADRTVGSAADRSVASAADKTVSSAADRTVSSAADKTVSSAADRSSSLAADRANSRAADRSSSLAADRANSRAADRSSSLAADRANSRAADRANSLAADKTVGSAADRAAGAAADRAAAAAANKTSN